MKIKITYKGFSDLVKMFPIVQVIEIGKQVTELKTKKLKKQL